MNLVLRISSCVGLFLCAAFGMASIHGVVFDDANGNAARDPGEVGIAGIPVSDQERVVVTDSEGRYELPDAQHATVFVSMPSGYEAPLHPDSGVPQFFRNIHTADRGLFKSTGPVPASLDFALRKRPDDGGKARAIVVSDPQVGGRDQIAHYRSDIIDELIGEKADFVVSLGDISGEVLSLLDDMAAATKPLGIPVLGVIGNHDRDYDAETQEENSATFKQVYGPDWYSFDRGNVHFVALNTVYYTGKGSGYMNGLCDKELNWLKADLALVPADRVVCLLMHIPLQKEVPSEEQKGFDVLLEMLKTRKAQILALGGHWHTNKSWRMGAEDGWTGSAPFHHYVVPVACGSWWGGPYDYRNVPYADQTDGTPNGYTIWDFDGASYKARFKAAGFSDGFQARVYTPEMPDPSIGANTVLANIFIAPYDAKAEMSLDGGDWKPMERINMRDPWARSIYTGPYSRQQSWANTDRCDHMWRGTTGKLASGLHTVRVRAPMLDGTTVVQGRTFVQD